MRTPVAGRMRVRWSLLCLSLICLSLILSACGTVSPAAGDRDGGGGSGGGTAGGSGGAADASPAPPPTSCRSDKDCTPLGMLCDRTLQHCVQCIDDSACPTGQHCRLEICTTAICTANATSCDGTNLVTCNAKGDGYASMQACAQSCTPTASGAKCTDVVAGLDAGTGATDGATPPPLDAGPDATSTMVVYNNALLISDFEDGRTELDGAYFAISGGPAGTISPMASDVEYATVLLTTSGYTGQAIHVTGSAPDDGSSYASLGVMMLRYGLAYDASMYDGIAFYARGTVSGRLFVGAMQPNDEPSKGSCIDGVTCYNRPGMALNVTTTWQRFVLPFAQLKSAVQGGMTVPLTPATINGWVFDFKGTFDFSLDEMYFVKASTN